MRKTIVITVGMLATMLAAEAVSAESLAPNTGPDPCSGVTVAITGTDIVPKGPAQTHTLTVSWTASAPPCFRIEGHVVRGVLTFRNGRTQSFAGQAYLSQTTLTLQVPGLRPPTLTVSPDPAMSPQHVTVNVVARATSQVYGSSSGSGVECPPNVSIVVTEAAFDGLVHEGDSYRPRVRVNWQLPGLPSCFSIDEFTIGAVLKALGTTSEKMTTAPGTQRSTSLVFDSFRVSPGFVPDRVQASIRASGQARITGSAQSESVVAPP